jgi:hypothetical protein
MDPVLSSPRKQLPPVPFTTGDEITIDRSNSVQRVRRTSHPFQIFKNFISFCSLSLSLLTIIDAIKVFDLIVQNHELNLQAVHAPENSGSTIYEERAFRELEKGIFEMRHEIREKDMELQV